MLLNNWDHKLSFDWNIFSGTKTDWIILSTSVNDFFNLELESLIGCQVVDMNNLKNKNKE